jgi:hypothetical protein
MTVRDRSPGPILRGRYVARAHRRARRQQIIGWQWVNRDASLFCCAPGSGPVARHAAAAPTGRSGSAVRRIEATAAGPDRRTLRHSKSGRGRSRCRSPPVCGSLRRGTAAPTPPRHAMAEHQVDLHHNCRDIGPACVPGTVWGTASSQTAKFRSRRRAYPSREASLTRQRLPDQRASVPGGCKDDGTPHRRDGRLCTRHPPAPRS